jgi:magnesium and cobalt exporter, CNNM family
MTLVSSFLCSLFEAALYSITPGQLGVWQEKGGPAARRLVRLRGNIEQPIAAILTINTIAHTVGSAWCGAMVGELWGSNALGLFAAIFTFLVLAVTEIVPKSIGVRYAARLGPAIAWPIQLMIWSVWPIVWLAGKAMALLAGEHTEAGPSEAEVLVLSRLAAHHGGVRPEEHRWVENALRLDKVNAGDLRTPRTVVETLSADQRVDALVAAPERWVHSRVPITEGGDPDQVIGIVHRREAFDAALSRPDAGLVLRDLMRPVRFVPETMPAHELLKLFLGDRSHMVAVTDEYGGFEGVVTLEDVLECLLGSEIVDEHDQVTDMQELALERSRERRGEQG